MSELFYSPFFGVALSIFTFWVGVRIQKKTAPRNTLPGRWVCP